MSANDEQFDLCILVTKFDMFIIDPWTVLKIHLSLELLLKYVSKIEDY